MAIRGQAAVLIFGLTLATAAGSSDPAAVARLVAEAQRNQPWYCSDPYQERQGRNEPLAVAAVGEDRARIDETNRSKAAKRGEWNGELRYDPSTKRILRLRYDGFECETMTLPDGAVVPRRVVTPGRAMEYSNFRRFSADVIIK